MDNIEDIQAHMALQCNCGSVKFNLRKDRQCECASCGNAWGFWSFKTKVEHDNEAIEGFLERSGKWLINEAILDNHDKNGLLFLAEELRKQLFEVFGRKDQNQVDVIEYVLAEINRRSTIPFVGNDV